MENQSRDAFRSDLQAERGSECGISFTQGKFAAQATAGLVVLAVVSTQRCVVRERMAANPSSRRVECSIINIAVLKLRRMGKHEEMKEII